MKAQTGRDIPVTCLCLCPFRVPKFRLSTFHPKLNASLPAWHVQSPVPSTPSSQSSPVSALLLCSEEAKNSFPPLPPSLPPSLSLSLSLSLFSLSLSLSRSRSRSRSRSLSLSLSLSRSLSLSLFLPLPLCVYISLYKDFRSLLSICYGFLKGSI